jgi:hypothetical protein
LISEDAENANKGEVEELNNLPIRGSNNDTGK